MNKLTLATIGTTAVLLAACSDATTSTPSPTTNNTLAPSAMASVYSATPAGFEELSSSFNSTGSEEAFLPDFDSHGEGRGNHADDRRRPGFGLGLMGGGLGGFLLGDGLLNDHFIRFRTGHCAFQADVGVVCADTTRGGRVVSSKTIRYTTASGTLQQQIDSSTDAIELTAAVKGGITRRDSSTSTVDESNHQKVTGLTGASRTVNSETKGTETSTGMSIFGAFTATRSAGDTIVDVVIPKATRTTARVYPTSGTVVRTMSATINVQGATLTTTRKETITYDGSATAKVVIVKDGVTQNCTLPLPHGALSCS